MGGGKGKQKMKVAEYRLSTHFGICHGPVRLRQLFFGEKPVWNGNVAGLANVPVNSPDLFGGPAKEGGVVGNVTFLPGDSEQVMPSHLASRLGRSSATCPGFRGLASVFLYGASSPGVVDASTTVYSNTRVSVSGDHVNASWQSAYNIETGYGPVQLEAVSPGSLPDGLAAGVDYWLNISGESRSGKGGTTTQANIKFATSEANATAGPFVDITSQGTGAFNIIGVATINVNPTGGFNGGRLGALFPRGTAGANLSGFNWGHNSPYLKAFWAMVTDDVLVPELPDDLATIVMDNLEHANPAHIIFQCLTDSDWGMGAPATALDIPSFLSAAETLYDEGFGLSLGWFQQSSIETFVSEILDHIQATAFVSPETGLFTIKLLRDDYDVDALPHYDESNCRLFDFQRKSWGETVNEIVVTYTNPLNESEATVSVQELGNVISQGGVVSDSRNYYGIRNADLAARIAQRDVRTAAAPLASCTIEVDRRAYSTVPGGVIKVSNTKLGFSNVVFRVGNVDYGKTGEAKIRVSLLEDIFGLRVGAYFAPPDTEHQIGAEFPAPMDYTKPITLPAFLVAQFSGAFPDDAEVFTAVLASTGGTDTARYELWNEGVTLSGSVEYQNLSNQTLNGRTTLGDPLAQEAQSIIAFGAVTLGVGPELEGFAYIGDASHPDAECEIIFLSDLDSNDNWIVERGMLDTVPRAWPAGTQVFFISPDVPFGDTIARAEAETVKYKLLPVTSLGTLQLDDAPEIVYTADLRPNRPIRPANVRINGFGYSDPSAPIDLVAVAEADGDLTVEWANRNRDMEETRVFLWTEAGITPPTTVKTVVRLFTAAGTMFGEHFDLPGESYLLDPYEYSGKNLIRINVKAHSEDSNSAITTESLQGYDLYVRVGYGGWGLNWGYSWGGGA